MILLKWKWKENQSKLWRQDSPLNVHIIRVLNECTYPSLKLLQKQFCKGIYKLKIYTK